jgi:L-seryl-tRNA(Ser) seleniumtransferase
MNKLRILPSVDQLLQTPLAVEWKNQYGYPLTLQAIRAVLEKIRQDYRVTDSIPDREEIFRRGQDLLDQWTAPSLYPVINAAGVILHTNLGRAPLSRAAIQAIQEVAAGYSNLEYDLVKGQRGSRLVHAEQLLQRLTGAEAGLVVNNNAGAVLLVLTALARRRAVVIARSQLVEIGGGFRVPDVMKQSGARLLEIGTTNRVHLADYEQAILEGQPALVMRAHRSNFLIIGFTSEPSLEEVAMIAHQAEIPVLDDLGSGSFLDTTAYGLVHEPTVGESLADGADLVCFSGDKLLGGPQAGIIVGKANLINRIKKHPLARAIRADKLCLAGLSMTLQHYLKDEAEREIPIWQMIAAKPESLQTRAQHWVEALGQGTVLESRSTIGGGSLPGETMPTYVLALTVRSPERFMARLRGGKPPVIARVESDRVVFDPRTVLADQEDSFLAVVRSALG